MSIPWALHGEYTGTCYHPTDDLKKVGITQVQSDTIAVICCETTAEELKMPYKYLTGTLKTHSVAMSATLFLLLFFLFMYI